MNNEYYIQKGSGAKSRRNFKRNKKKDRELHEYKKEMKKPSYSRDCDIVNKFHHLNKRHISKKDTKAFQGSKRTVGRSIFSESFVEKFGTDELQNCCPQKPSYNGGGSAGFSSEIKPRYLNSGGGGKNKKEDPNSFKKLMEDPAFNLTFFAIKRSHKHLLDMSVVNLMFKQLKKWGIYVSDILEVSIFDKDFNVLLNVISFIKTRITYPNLKLKTRWRKVFIEDESEYDYKYEISVAIERSNGRCMYKLVLYHVYADKDIRERRMYYFLRFADFYYIRGDDLKKYLYDTSKLEIITKRSERQRTFWLIGKNIRQYQISTLF